MSLSAPGVLRDRNLLESPINSSSFGRCLRARLNPGKLPLFFFLAVSCQQRPIVLPPPIEFYLQKI